MNTLRLWTPALLSVLSLAGIGDAWYRSPALGTPLLPAPDACGPGFYTICCDGTAYGPNYCVYPPFAPFSGFLPGEKGRELQQLQGQGMPYGYYHYGQGPAPQPGYAPNLPTPGYAPYGVPLPSPGYIPPPQPQGPPSFPSHPFARSPRDFFMWSDVMQDKIARSARPSLVP